MIELETPLVTSEHRHLVAAFGKTPRQAGAGSITDGDE